MALLGTINNFGGKIPAQQQVIKQFVLAADNNQAYWYYKKLSSGLIVQTPVDAKKPVYISNDLYVTGSIFNTSDINLKENIKMLNLDRTKELFNINPVEFSFKSDIKKTIHYGFIAQEIEKIYPELIGSNNLGYKTVNYLEIIPILLSKMKLMQTEIDELKNKLETINIDK
jgi:hypothetical protein